jgi:exosome complex component RRP4
MLVVPGQVLTTDSGFLRGHGTYIEYYTKSTTDTMEDASALETDTGMIIDDDAQDDPPDSSTVQNSGQVKQRLVSSVLGYVSRVNKLISVHPLSPLYTGSVGDLVVGRVVEVQNSRWKVHVCSTHLGNLKLSSVNLPDGVQRVRNKEDTLNMRALFKEGDVVGGEVQQVNGDGTIQVRERGGGGRGEERNNNSNPLSPPPLLKLHARSARYGKLSNGLLCSVPPCLVKRSKSHNLTLPTETPIDVLLGCNGNLWIQRHVELDKNKVEGVEDIEKRKVRRRGGGEPVDLIVTEVD